MKKKFVFFALVLAIAFNAVGVYGQTAQEYLEQGNNYLDQKDYDRAITAYSQVIRLAPNAPQGYNLRGVAYFYKKDYDKAIADLNEGIRLNTDAKLKSYAYYYRGRSYDDKKNYDQAIADYTEAIRLNPNEADYYAHRGYAYYKKEYYRHAEADYEAALSINPKNLMAITGSGGIKIMKEGLLANKYNSSPVPTAPAIPPPPPAPVYVTQTCSTCKGAKRLPCGTCGGAGQIKFMDAYTIPGYGFSPDIHMPAVYGPCWRCNGAKTLACDTCGGVGTVQVLQTAAQPAQPQPQPATPAPTTTKPDFEMNGTTLVKYNGSAKNVTIPNNVKVIGEYAFSESGVSNLTIPSGVTTIEGGAFFMSALSSISIPASVTFIDIDSVPFNHCTRLTSITVDAQNRNYSSVDGVLFSKDKKTLIQYPAGKNSSSYTIPSGVTTIWGQAFCYSGRLTSVTIPSSVTTIGYWSFARSGLTSVTIPSSVTSIEDYAFGECESLTSVTLSRNTQIGDDAFPSGAKITYSDPAPTPQTTTVSGANLLFPADGVTLGKTTVNELMRMGTRAANIDKDTKQPYLYYVINGFEVWYDEKTNLAERYYIVNWEKLPAKWASTGMSFENSYDQWLDYAKRNNLNVQVKKNPQTGTYDGHSTFVAELVFSYTAEGILYEIELDFNYSTGTKTSDKKTLYSIRVRGKPTTQTATTQSTTNRPSAPPASVSTSSDFEIRGTTLVTYNGSATNVTIPSNVTVIGQDAFLYDDLTGVTIPNGVITIGESAFMGNKLTSVTIPNSVTTIGKGAFWDNQLTSVTIGSGVITIGGSAFHENKLRSVTIPNSVITIGESAFRENQLTSVTIGNKVTTIEEYAFWQNQLSSITIPNSVTSIGNYAFNENNLTSIIIPNSVKTIGRGAFDDNKITSVTIGANVNLGTFAIGNDFEDFYNKNGKKADTYAYDGKNWTAKSAPARPTPAPQPTPTPEQPPPRGVVYPEHTGPNGIAPTAWKPSDGESPGVTKRGYIRKEVIDGQERDTLSMEVTFPRQTASGGGKWGAFTINDETNLSKIRTATGVRFKAQGDGKRWIIQFHTKETMADWGSYEAEIQTVPNRVVEINIPYSSLAQPSWGKKVPFVKSNIMSVNLQRMTDSASETGPSTLKVFDFEVYSQPAAPPPSTANVNPNFIPPSEWNLGDGDAEGVTKKIFKTREVIAGQEKDVLTMEVTFPRQNGSKWGSFSAGYNEQPFISRMRTGSGIRFKAQGDGKRWIIQIILKVSGEDCGYEAEIKTTNNKVVDINIPYSSLKQADWGKKAPWNKNSIDGVNIQRNSSDTGNTSTLKVFDFEVY